MALPSSRDEILLLHNPKCSKSRQTLSLLEGRGVAVTTRLYLEQPLTAEELGDLGRRLDKRAIEFTRTKQAEFAEAGLTKESAEEEIFAAMVGAPILMERPVLIRGNRARIGRPPEEVLDLLGD